jgi:hypothetical protein
VSSDRDGVHLTRLGHALQHEKGALDLFIKSLDPHVAHRRSFSRMPMPPLIVEEGQFDDAPIDIHPEDVRQGYNYIDETRRDQLEDGSDGDGSGDIYSEGSEDDFTRVEDEDWEIAERGTRLSFTAVLHFYVSS